MCLLGVFLGVIGAWLVIVCEAICTLSTDCYQSVTDNVDLCCACHGAAANCLPTIWRILVVINTASIRLALQYTPWWSLLHRSPSRHQIKDCVLSGFSLWTFLFSCFGEAVARLLRYCCAPPTPGSWKGLWWFWVGSDVQSGGCVTFLWWSLGARFAMSTESPQAG